MKYLFFLSTLTLALSDKFKTEAEITANYHARMYVKSDQCSITFCKEPYGKCVNDTICLCQEGYVNNKYTIGGGKTICSYGQKSYWVAFLFELLLPIGIGHFYIDDKLMGGIKLAVFTICPAILAYMSQSNYFHTEKIQNNVLYALLSVFFFTTLGFSLIVWWFVDAYLFYINSYTDGQGIPLI